MPIGTPSKAKKWASNIVDEIHARNKKQKEVNKIMTNTYPRQPKSGYYVKPKPKLSKEKAKINIPLGGPKADGWNPERNR